MEVDLELRRLSQRWLGSLRSYTEITYLSPTFIYSEIFRAEESRGETQHRSRNNMRLSFDAPIRRRVQVKVRSTGVGILERTSALLDFASNEYPGFGEPSHPMMLYTHRQHIRALRERLESNRGVK